LLRCLRDSSNSDGGQGSAPGRTEGHSREPCEVALRTALGGSPACHSDAPRHAMTTNLYLSRARLRSSRGEALSAIAPLLIPRTRSERAGNAHRILWLLFQNDPNARRDFLWRDEGRGRFLILSKRRPSDPLGVFDIETKPFDPVLTSGDRLAFALRANPVIATKQAATPRADRARVRSRRVDVVLHALYRIPKAERAPVRD